MIEKITRRFSVVAIALAAMFVLTGGCSSDKPNQPPAVTPPDITTFTGTPTDIVPGDSVLLSYVVVRTDSLKLFPSGQTLSNTGSGSLYVKPTSVTTYVLRAYNRGGQDSAFVSVTMNAAVPSITAMTVSEDTVVVGDSTQVTWTAIQTDSIKLNGGAKLTPAAGSTVWAIPPVNGQLSLIAYNAYGTDTARVLMRVEVPYAIQSVNATRFFKGEMGSALQAPQMQIRVVDFQARPLYKAWIKASIVEGDGVLIADSLQATAGGFATFEYDFSGSSGHALIRLSVSGIDSLEAIVRANTITLGENFQGQYVRRGDPFWIVRGFYDDPVSVDSGLPTQSPFLVANYEALIGLAVIFEDADGDKQLDSLEYVNDEYLDSTSVILNDNGAIPMTAMTAEGIGVGSSLSSIRLAYGAPDFAEFEPGIPDTVVVYYLSEGLVLFCGTNPATTQDTIVGELHIRPPQ